MVYYFETGLWLILIVVAGVFTFVSLKVVGGAKPAFMMLSLALWFGLGMIHASGYEIAAYTNSTWTDTGSTIIWSNSNYERLIPGGTTASWLSYLFFGFAIFNIFNLFKEVIIPKSSGR